MTGQIHERFAADPRVILLIPTVEDREFLAETLASVRKHAHCFDQLLLSVNGTSPHKAQNILLEQKIASQVDSRVFCTRIHLSAIGHLRFIHQKLASHVRDLDLIFLLADDDILPINANIYQYIQSVRAGQSTTVGMGRFAVFDLANPVPVGQPQHIAPGESIETFEFLKRNQQGHRFTNMSSMLVPYVILKEASLFMWRIGSAGRRFEYILASHKRVSFLYSPPGYSALIREHADQEGRTLSFESFLHDELVYIFWVWLHQPAMRPWAKSVGHDFSFYRFWLLLKDLLIRKLKSKSTSRIAIDKKAKSLN